MSDLIPVYTKLSLKETCLCCVLLLPAICVLLTYFLMETQSYIYIKSRVIARVTFCGCFVYRNRKRGCIIGFEMEEFGQIYSIP